MSSLSDKPDDSDTDRSWTTATPPNDEEHTLPLSDAEEKERRDPNIVDWDGDVDPANPRNWSQGYKNWITFQLGMLALAASLGSSIIAPGENAIAQYVGVSTEVTVLAISLYMWVALFPFFLAFSTDLSSNSLGFALGPLCWAPISEIWGRRWSMLPAMFVLGLFSIGTAVGKNAQTIFITRFFAGVFGSSPVSNVAAALGDIWEPKARGIATTFYAIGEHISTSFQKRF